MREMLLMSTLECHLCDVAAEILVNHMDPARFVVDVVDIAEDDALMEKYAVRIPVLVDEVSGRELDWPFNQAQLGEFIAGLPADIG